MKHLCPICAREMEIDDARLAETVGEALRDVEPQRLRVAQAAVDQMMSLIPAVAHDQCVADRNDRLRSSQRRAMEHKLARKWGAACPPAFQLTDYQKIVFRQKAEALEAVAAGQSVILNGESGAGKTRLLWIMARAPFMLGRKVQLWTHIQLANTIAEQALKGANWLSLLVQRAKDCDLLIIDDLGKARMVGHDGQSLKNEESLFEILDHRLAFQRQTVFSTNDSAETLASRMSDDKGRPLVRRIHDLCRSFTA